MLERHTLKMAFWMLLVGCGVGLMATRLPASQQPAVPVATEPPGMSAPPLSEDSVDTQMHAFQRHARVNQILYQGSFDRGERAALPARLDAIALTVKASGR